MKRAYEASSGKPLNGGAYFASREEMQSARHQAIAKLTRAMSGNNPKVFVQTMDEAVKEGWDISDLVIQDTFNSWFTLGAFLCSRANLSYSRIFQAYLDYPGIDLSRQCACINMKDPAPGQQHPILPISHVFMNDWALYLPPNTNRKRDTNHEKRHQWAKRFLEDLSQKGVKWDGVDTAGNTLAHLLVAKESTHALRYLLPMLELWGVDLSQVNDHGQTPRDLAIKRLEKEKSATTSHGLADLDAFMEIVSRLESAQITRQAKQAMSLGNRIHRL